MECTDLSLDSTPNGNLQGTHSRWGEVAVVITQSAESLSPICETQMEFLFAGSWLWLGPVPVVWGS